MTKVLVIGGPTASGKSGLAVGLAVALNGVIINGDSMQVYDGLPLLAAQPEASDLATAPHKLYRSLAPNQPCSAARWRDMALAEIAAAESAGQLPIIVGGTGFYLKTLMKGISPIPDIPQSVRDALNAQLAEIGNKAFHALLAAKDPVMAAKLAPGNSQRLVRAMEVLTHTGKSLAAWQEGAPVGTPAHLDFLFVTLLPPRERLYAQCNKRFDLMIDAGALDEAATFTAQYPYETAAEVPLKKALGYPEIAAYQRGEMTLEEAKTKATQSTRHYAKRQMTWFRNQLKADMVLETSDPQPVIDTLQKD